jgi:hypothetical protein
MSDPETASEQSKFIDFLVTAYGGLMSDKLSFLVANFATEISAKEQGKPPEQSALVTWMSMFRDIIPAGFSLRNNIIMAAEDAFRYEYSLPAAMLDAVVTHPDLNVAIYVGMYSRYNRRQMGIISYRSRAEEEYNLTSLLVKLHPLRTNVLSLFSRFLK